MIKENSMKIYKNQNQLEKEIKDCEINFNGQDVLFECKISVHASIVNAGNIRTKFNIDVCNIQAHNIDAHHITAWDINVINNIKAGVILSVNINARDISALRIYAYDVTARDVYADDIIVTSINAVDISYGSFLMSRKHIKCKSWIKRDKKGEDPICLDGQLDMKTNVPLMEQDVRHVAVWN
jgi:hypothetical protein